MWTSTVADVERPTYAPDRPRSRRIDDVGRPAHARAITAPRFEHLGVQGFPKTSGQRAADLGADQPGRRSPRHARVEIPHTIAGVAGDLVSAVGEEGTRWTRAPRLHTERAEQDARRAALGARALARWPLPIARDELDDTELRSDRWTIRDVPATRSGRRFDSAMLRRSTFPVQCVSPGNPGTHEGPEVLPAGAPIPYEAGVRMSPKHG
jgi:bifunctional non-homologous end joining protein LigD